MRCVSAQHSADWLSRFRNFLYATCLVAPVLAVTTVGSTTSAASSADPVTGKSSVVAPTSPPSPPLLESVAPRGLGLMVSWYPAPADEQVSTYDVTATPAAGSATADCPAPGPVTESSTAASSAALITGLCAKVAYSVTVTATNDVAQSEPSGEFDPIAVLSAQTPEAPLLTDIFGRDGALVVAWAAPSYDGGAPLSGYLLTVREAAPDGQPSGPVVVSAQPSAGDESVTVTGLSNGRPYHLELVAQNSVGSSVASHGLGTPAPAYVPGSAQLVTAVPAGSGRVELTWDRPVDDGGSTISGYSVAYQAARLIDGEWRRDAHSSVVTQSAAAGARSHQFSNLPQPTSPYYFGVATSNAVGAGEIAWSAAPVVPSPEATETLIPIAGTDADAMIRVDSEQVAFEASSVSARLRGIGVDSVLAAEPTVLAPQGFLRTVTEILDDGELSGELVVATRQATLDEAFTNMALTATPGEDVADTFVPAAPGLRYAESARPSAARAIGLAVDKSLSASFSYTHKAGGSSVSLTAKTTVTVGLGASVTTGAFGVPDGMRVNAKATVEASLAGQAKVERTFTKRLGEIRGAPIAFTIGPVPVVVVPVAPIDLKVSGTAKAGFESKIVIGGELTWDSADSGRLKTNRTVKVPGGNGRPLADVSASAEVSAALSVAPGLEIYDLAGPYLSVDLELKASFNPSPGAGQHFLTVSLSASLKAGLRLDLLKGRVKAALETKIGASLSWTIFTISSPPSSYSLTSPVAKLEPGESTQLQARRNDGGTAVLTWRVVDGVQSDRVSSSGVFTAGGPGGRVVTIEAFDSTGARGEVVLRVGTPMDSPGRLHADQESDFTSATITWQSPTNTGGRPLQGYRLQVQPGNIRLDLDAGATSASLAELAPGDYVVNLVAINIEGRQSAPATTDLEMRPGCSTTFTGAVDDNWTRAGNWSGGVPGPSSWVCIDSPARIPASSSVSVGGLRNDLDLTVSGRLAVDYYAELRADVRGAGGLEIGNTATVKLGSSRQSIGFWDVDVVNRGTIKIAPGAYVASCYSAMTLLNEGVIELERDQGLQFDSQGCELVNSQSGFLRIIDSGDATAFVRGPLVNRGRLDIGSSMLDVTDLVWATSGTLHGDADGRLMVGQLRPDGATATLPVSSASLHVRGRIAGGEVVVPAKAALTWGSIGWGVVAHLDEASLVNRGTVSLEYAAYVGPRGLLRNEGLLELAQGHQVTVDSGGESSFINAQGATIQGPQMRDGFAWIYGPFSNRGTLDVGSGGLQIDTVDWMASASVVGSQDGRVSAWRLTASESLVLPSTDAEMRVGELLAPEGSPSPEVRIPSGGSLILGERTVGHGGYVHGVDLVNDGVLTWEYAGTIAEDASVINRGVMGLHDGISIYAAPSGSPQLVNEVGAVLRGPQTPGEQAWVYGDLVNRGEVRVGAGRLDVDRATWASSGSLVGTADGRLETRRLSPDGDSVTLPVSDVQLRAGDLGGGTIEVPRHGSLVLGSAEIGYGGYVHNTQLTNRGHIRWEYAGTVEVDASIHNSGTIALSDSVVLTLVSMGISQLENAVEGTIAGPAEAGQSASIDGTLTNRGHLDVGSGALWLRNARWNSTASLIGTVNGELRVRQLITDDATTVLPVSEAELVLEDVRDGKVIVPIGAEVQIGSNEYSAGGYVTNADLVNRGTLRWEYSGAVEADASMVNEGTMELGNSLSIHLVANEASQFVNASTGVIRAPQGEDDTASISGAMTNHGRINVGAGSLDVTSLVMSDSSELKTTVYSDGRNVRSGRLTTGSGIRLDGTLRLDAVNGLIAPPGTQVRVLDSAQRPREDFDHVSAGWQTVVDDRGVSALAVEDGGAGPAVTSDFDGDGRSDRAVYRGGRWLSNSGIDTWFGLPGWASAPGDFDGDGRTDLGAWDPSTGAWHSPALTRVEYFGLEGDVPVPADYDGDGGDELAVWRPAIGGWFIRGEAVTYLGLSTDVPVPADYDGDGDVDLAVYRPETGAWFIEGADSPAYFGLSTDIPVPGDYDGNGSAEIAVWRPETGAWFVDGRATPLTYFGLSTDVPVPGRYTSATTVDVSVFRPGSGAWLIPGSPATYFGGDGDRPLALSWAVWQHYFLD